jgi:hypothetical protein
MLGINQWIVDLTGIEGSHDWWCFQFDAAVSHLGRTIEGKLQETDDKGRKLHRLEDFFPKIETAKKNPSISQLKSAISERANIQGSLGGFQFG